MSVITEPWRTILIYNPRMYRTLSLGIVMRRTPGVTRWAKYFWKASAVLPGAGPADWLEMRREGEAVEYHAATVNLELHGAETEAYLFGLQSAVPAVYVVLRHEGRERPEVLLATASPYEAQDYNDSGEELVERVAMPEALRSWVTDFVDTFHTEETFKKRRRDRKEIDLSEDGIGDPRIAGASDVYASPALKRGRLQ